MGAIDRYGSIVEDPMDSRGVILSNKPLMGIVIEGTGSFGVEVFIDADDETADDDPSTGTWYTLDPQIAITAGVAVSSDVFTPLAAYCVAPVRVRLDSYTRSEERRVGKEGRSRWSPDH